MWNTFLEKSSKDLMQNSRNLVVLGRSALGKRSLLDCIVQHTKTFVGSRGWTAHNPYGVQYYYLNVQSKDDHDLRVDTKLNIYMIKETTNLSILQPIIDENFISNMGVLIVLDHSEPWTFFQDLNRWFALLNQLITIAKPSLALLEKLQEQVVSYAKLFKLPEFNQNGKLIRKKLNETEESALMSSSLSQGLLMNNPRVPVIVAVNKSDLIYKDKAQNYKATIQFNLRKFCAQNGAALFFTSSKYLLNIESIYQYLLHRLYNLPLRSKVQTSNQQSILIPFGYDHKQIIDSSFVGVSVHQPFQTVVPHPSKFQKEEPDIICHTIDSFLKKPEGEGSSENVDLFYNDLLRAQTQRRKKAEQAIKKKQDNIKKKRQKKQDQ